MEHVTLAPARARAVERIREIVMGLTDALDVRVYLFGSCATGTLRGSSDIDVAIESSRGPIPELLGTLRERFEESDVPYDVDVVDLAAVSSEFAHRVCREGVLWSRLGQFR